MTENNACMSGNTVAKLSKTVRRVYVFLILLLAIVLIVSGSLIVLGIEKHNQHAVLDDNSTGSLLGNVYFMVGLTSTIISTAFVIFAVVAYSTIATDVYAAQTLQCMVQNTNKKIEP